MAKLSANGATVVVRWKREKMIDGERHVDSYALRSDGVLLSKMKIGEYDYGWKVETRKPKPEADLDRILTGRGFRRERA